MIHWRCPTPLRRGPASDLEVDKGENAKCLAMGIKHGNEGHAELPYYNDTTQVSPTTSRRLRSSRSSVIYVPTFIYMGT
jgi:hypothetical protein